MIEGVPTWLSHAIILAGLFYASYTDLKTREVPDILNYSLMALGVILAGTASILQETFLPVLHSILGLLGGYLLGALMFYTGQWGGGDAKMLMAVGAFHGISISQLLAGEFPLFFTTFVSFMLAGALYGLIYALVLMLRRFKTVMAEVSKFHSQGQAAMARNIVLGVGVVGLVVALLIQAQIISIFIGLVTTFLVVGYYLLILGRVVEKTCMIQTVPLNKVTVGDWIVEDIHIRGKRVCGPKDLGISEKQLGELKKHKVKAVKVKYGIPFIPGFLLGYALILIFGNWIVQLLTLL
ncbi:MAG: prepilin peptidase [Candidatus Woesearchaeota archaeon]